MTENPLQGREVIFEFQSIGQYVKVMAMDTATMTEITIQGPVTASEAVLKSNAAKKLEYVLKKKGLI
ncbi:MAG TPA: hypothetical protein VL625_02070 [Patescibacteria group bacterium]|jgi:hypothetical protein|nr:hypothetical protein [Patescibacteria group bacterium]